MNLFCFASNSLRPSSFFYACWFPKFWKFWKKKKNIDSQSFSLDSTLMSSRKRRSDKVSYTKTFFNDQNRCSESPLKILVYLISASMTTWSFDASDLWQEISRRRLSKELSIFLQVNQFGKRKRISSYFREIFNKKYFHYYFDYYYCITSLTVLFCIF